MMKYLHVKQTLNNKGDLVPFEDSEQDLSKLEAIIGKAPGSDWYRSLFWYGQEAKEYFDKHEHSISDYKGEVLSNILTFDFDSKADPSKAQEDVKSLLKSLQGLGVSLSSSTAVYFSGNKGFHVEVAIDQYVTPEQMKSVCSNMAKDLNTFDSVIYNTTRIYRLPNTKHQHTGLYKIPLTLAEIKDLSIEQIKAKAKNKGTWTPTLTPAANVDLVHKYKTAEKPKLSVVVDDSESNGIRGLSGVNFNKCPKTTPRCIYALEHGIMVPKSVNSSFGGRSHLFLRLATFYRNQGKPKEVVHNILKGIARLNHKLYPEAEAITKEEIYMQHIASAYSDKSVKYHSTGGPGTSSEDSQLKHYCDSLHTEHSCCLHGAKSSTVLKINEVADSFGSYAENLDNNLVRTGIDFIDQKMKITVGTTTLLVGAPGSGKTTLALNIMENANSLGQQTMFFSLDMGKNLVYQKLAQKVTNYTQDEILNAYKNKNTGIINEVKKAISERYGLTFFEFSKAMKIEDLRDVVLKVQEKEGANIRLVVVDYAGRIPGPSGDSHANANFNAIKSTEVAEDTNAAWLIICQIARGVGDGSTPLRTKRAAKESGAWEESASNVITMWRPFMGIPEDDRYVRIFLAKNRMGEEAEKVLKWNGHKGTISEFTEEDMINWQEDSKKEQNLYKVKSAKSKFPR